MLLLTNTTATTNINNTGNNNKTLVFTVLTTGIYTTGVKNNDNDTSDNNLFRFYFVGLFLVATPNMGQLLQTTFKESFLNVVSHTQTTVLLDKSGKSLGKKIANKDIFRQVKSIKGCSQSLQHSDGIVPYRVYNEN